MTYVQAAMDRGLDVNQFGQRLSFFFNVHNNFFEEIAKFRAARRMWAHIMKGRFQATEPKAMKLRFHSQTAGSTLTAQQPFNNVVRVTHQALAAILGGTQSLHTNSMDEALGLPTELAATVALRTQQILAYETGVTDVVDPLAGSFYVENLTDQLEKLALDYIHRIEQKGGVVACVESGWIQNEIQNAAYLYQKEVDRKEEIVVGINAFEQEEQAKIETLKVPEHVSQDQLSRLKKFKSQRDSKKVKTLIEQIQQAAQTNENLMPLFVEAVENHVTLGEISESLRKVFGLYKETITI
jgi:methylmalonyl-CoA mutase, N-terminal domain